MCLISYIKIYKYIITVWFELVWSKNRSNSKLNCHMRFDKITNQTKSNQKQLYGLV